MHVIYGSLPDKYQACTLHGHVSTSDLECTAHKSHKHFVLNTSFFLPFF